jgi:predicted metal-binding membrane protein
MTFILAVIALPGIAAVLLRWSRAVFVTARYSIERFVAGQIADTRAQRGDISGMSEAEVIRRNSRAAAVRALLQLILWSVALIVPFFLPGTLLIFVLYGLLWFVPSRPGTEVKRT